MPGNLLRQIRDEGVSPWLDGVTRDELHSGAFRALIDDLGVSGVTTNPTLFAKSLCGAPATYEDGLDDLAARGVGPDEAARLLAAQDARDACDILWTVHQESGGHDGWVSLEVDPRFADDVEATLAEVRALAWLVDRPNLMVKVPATLAGVSAVAAATAEGYSINATLIFSVERYLDILGAYAVGLERAMEAGVDLSGIHSVASLFVSRVDAALAARPPGGQPSGEAGTVLPGLANARNAYRAFSEAMGTSSWRALVAAGANPQRLLWASTGVKDPKLDPTTYVAGLALPGTVSTMPRATLTAAAQAPTQPLGGGPTATDVTEEIRALAELDELKDELMPGLLASGVAQFQKSWQVVLAVVGERLATARAGRSSAQP
ncbi:transaldolase [Myceligenerans pegani]|uniref:Transaldolase n=1 Tax=Myceligenerans pegani TaxID=2776917 RepID=A0ABR9MZV9_9MICO|nr:transaldolase [Myceligenerans sp. TRM 65318]MBE1876531.1 transaldolase [Myceligenerans sp. TRM 65318]MBE3018802.1 transaldolase [Myceligenerans sp. TRM 65318]